MQELVSLRINAESCALQGAYCMWIKSVKGFLSTKHCAKCLVGEFIKIKDSHFKEPFLTNTTYAFALDSAPLPNSRLINNHILHYFCIVATPTDYHANIHAGFIYEKGAKVERVFKGQNIVLENAKEIPFDNSMVKAKYAHLSDKFTSCRNFWFGAYYYG